MPAPAAVPAAAPITVPRTRLPLSRRLPSTPPATAPTVAPMAVLLADWVPSACVVQAARSRTQSAEHALRCIRDSLRRTCVAGQVDGVDGDERPPHRQPARSIAKDR